MGIPVFKQKLSVHAYERSIRPLFPIRGAFF